MSWTASASTTTDKVAEVEYSTSPQPLEGEPLQAFAAARSAAEQLIEAGAVGEGEIAINLNGHANPNHVREGKWAADQVALQIRRLDQD